MSLVANRRKLNGYDLPYPCDEVVPGYLDGSLSFDMSIFDKHVDLYNYLDKSKFHNREDWEHLIWLTLIDPCQYIRERSGLYWIERSFNRVVGWNNGNRRDASTEVCTVKVVLFTDRSREGWKHPLTAYPQRGKYMVLFRMHF